MIWYEWDTVNKGKASYRFEGVLIKFFKITGETESFSSGYSPQIFALGSREVLGTLTAMLFQQSQPQTDPNTQVLGDTIVSPRYGLLLSLNPLFWAGSDEERLCYWHSAALLLGHICDLQV